jgi:hypothetical protein
MRRALPLTVLAIAFAGCGTTAPKSSVDNFKDPEQRAVAQKVEDLADAGKRNKPDDICSDILSQQLVSQLNAAGTDCATEMKKAIEDANDFELDVRKVTINGDAATAEVRQGTDGPTETMQFAREKDQWRATALSGG